MGAATGCKLSRVKVTGPCTPTQGHVGDVVYGLPSRGSMPPKKLSYYVLIIIMVNALVNYDALLFTFVNSHHTLFLDRMFLIITQFGNGWIVVPLIALVIILKTPRKYLAKVPFVRGNRRDDFRRFEYPDQTWRPSRPAGTLF